jgi:dolichyl-diphosphooligosaccharide--protein glycosyltransferase
MRVLTVFWTMSSPSESESFSERFEGFEAPLERLREVYHVPLLGAMFAFMLWVRARYWERFVQADGGILFSGNDAWYHYRMVQYTVREFPGTMPFDPWTTFPVGTSVGQFGTLYDQLMALAALVVGLGSPTTEQIGMVMLFTPAVLGALTVFPVYVLGARVSNRIGGLIAALVVTLSPGQFLSRSLVGFTDHHVAETFFMALAVLAVLAAIRVAMRDKPIWELFTAGEFDALRPTLLWSALAGVGVSFYIWVWPPGAFLVGILGVFFGAAMLGQYVRGTSPDHLAVVGAVVGLVTAVLTGIQVNEFGLSASQFSLTQPLLALGLTLGAVVVAGGARLWDDRDLDRRALPLALLSGAFALALVVALAAPDVFGFFTRQVTRIVGFGSSVTSLTVGEAQPPQNASQFLYNSYGLAFGTAVGGVIIAGYRAATEAELAPQMLFLVVWGVFLMLATLTQQRFDYYLVLAVAGANAVFFTWVFEFVDLGAIAEDVSNLSAYQVLTILAVLMVLTVPMTFRAGGGYQNAVQIADRSAGPGSVQNWDESLAWLDAETPEVGAYSVGGDGDLEHYGTYQRQDDFQYSEGSYGVISWWDYGHWITVLGERPAFANPFQQQAREAANFLLATNESHATDVATSESGETSRYVMIDYQLGVSGTTKFSAPAAWEAAHNVSGRSLSQPVYAQTRSGIRLAFAAQSERSMRSLRTRLYQHHGSAVGPESPNSALGSRVLIVDWDVQSFQGQQFPVLPEDREPLKVRENLSEAREFVRQDGSAQIGGVLGEPRAELDALEHYRLVHTSPRETTVETSVSRVFRIVEAARQGQGTSPNSIRPIETQPWVKTFERVPGATVEGEGPANATVTASVRMTVDGGANFTYRQTARTGSDGTFTMTLPYSTTGYTEYGPENGYTNVSVRAAGPYQFSTTPQVNESAYIVREVATANVSEGKVVGDDGAPVSVTLETQVLSEPEGANQTNTSDTNTTNTSDTSGDSVSTNTTSTNETSSLAGPSVLAPVRG